MATSFLLSDASVRINRPFLMRRLGLQYNFEFAGDIPDTRPVSLDSPSTLRVHQNNVPFLNYGATHERCSGCTLTRFERTTMAIPCFSSEIVPGGSVCAHCNELWNASMDDQHCFQLDKDTMLEAAALYAPGAGNNLFRLPAMKPAEDLFSEQISLIKQVFDGSEHELSAAWPGCAFKDVIQSVMIDSGIVFPESGKKAMKRSAVQQKRLANFAHQLIPLWLRVRSFVELDELNARIADLALSAKVIVEASLFALQKQLPRDPVLTGAITVADVMMSGFVHAAKIFDVVVARAVGDPGKRTDESPEFSWGDHLPVFMAWADTVQPAQRPPRRKLQKASAADAPPDASGSGSAGAAVPSPAPRRFYAVAAGRKTGVYASMTEVREQTKGFLGCKMRVFHSQADAEEYVERFRRAPAQPPPSVAPSTPQRQWYVAVGGARPGVYEHQHVALFYAKVGGEVSTVGSMAEARSLLSHPAPPYFRECTVPDAIDLSKSSARAGTNTASASDPIDLSTSPPEQDCSFFTVIGGDNPGVYSSEEAAFDAVTAGGGVFFAFATKALAEEHYQREVSAVMERTSYDPKPVRNAFVVWAGRTIGVMTRAACMKSTAGMPGVRMKGPLTPDAAFALWTQKEAIAEVLCESATKKPKLATRAQAEISPGSSNAVGVQIDKPSVEEFERAERLSITRVFACRVNENFVRISLSYEGAVAGKRHLEVKSFFAKDTLVDNLAAAEFWAKTFAQPAKRPFATRAAEARRKLFVEDTLATTTPFGESISPAQAQSSQTKSTSGQSGGDQASFLGVTGMVRSSRLEQMKKCFVDAPQAIRIESFGQPTPDELDEENINLPGSAQYLVSAKRDSTSWKLEDWVQERKQTIKAWPLMGFSDFMSFCRKAIKMCLASSKPAAVVNAAALNELMDIAIRLHRHMSRLRTLGKGEVRFKARMFLHLQFATLHRVMYTSASAMSVFRDATEVFMTRLPQSAFRDESSASPAKTPSSSRESVTGSSPGKKTPASKKSYSHSSGTPRSGCYLCPDVHYASDRSKHPLDANGKHAMPTKKTQEAIFARIDNESMSDSAKSDEKKKVKKFWACRCAP